MSSSKAALIEQLAKAEFERDGLVLSEVNRQTRLYESCHRFAKNAMPLIVAFVATWLSERTVSSGDGWSRINVGDELNADWLEEMA